MIKIIKVFGKSGCTQCHNIVDLLENKNIPFEYTDNFVETAKIGSKYKIMSAPIIIYENKAFNYIEALELIKKL